MGIVLAYAREEPQRGCEHTAREKQSPRAWRPAVILLLNKVREAGPGLHGRKAAPSSNDHATGNSQARVLHPGRNTALQNSGFQGDGGDGPNGEATGGSLGPYRQVS